MVEAKIYENGEPVGSIKGSLLIALANANGDRETFGSDGELCLVGDGDRADILEATQAIVQHMAEMLEVPYERLLLTLVLAGKRDTETVRFDG